MEMGGQMRVRGNTITEIGEVKFKKFEILDKILIKYMVKNEIEVML